MNHSPAQHPLFHYEVTVPKKESMFFYAILECLGGLCFYSTLHCNKVEYNRVIDIKGSHSTEEDFLKHLNFIAKKIPLTFKKVEPLENE